MARILNSFQRVQRERASSKLRMALVLIGGVLVLWVLVACVFTVDVTQFGVVTRFGRVVRVAAEPGLHLKAPFDRVVTLDKRLTSSRPAPAEYLTVDKRNVVVESLATWRVRDPARFLSTLATRQDADARLGDVVVGEIGSVLGTHPVSSLVAPDRDAQRFRDIVSEIRLHVADFARGAYGIEIVDVELLRLSLPEQNREHVFERMKAERGKMAKEYRTAGELQARKIVAEADREKTRIEAEAYAQAQRLKAEGDAEATRIYAAAFGRNPAFYKFLRTLQAYDKFLDENTTLFLPGDAEVLRVLSPPVRQGAGGDSQRGAVTVTAKPRARPQAVSAAGATKSAVGSGPGQELLPDANPRPQ